MANALLNADVITNMALQILHQKLNFITSINRQYDDSFGNEELKVGNTLRIRLPNQYTVSTGAALSVQDVTETNTSLTLATQKHVDVSFTTADLRMKVVDFAAQYIEPAMAVLAANVENDALSMLNSVYNVASNVGSAQTWRNVMAARKILVDNLVPPDDSRQVRLNTQDNLDMLDQLKGIFNPQEKLAAQYTDGVIGKTGGFTFAENTFLSQFTPGARNTAYTVNGAAQIGASLVVQAGSGAMVVGDIFTIAGVFRVHGETKATQSTLQQFVVTAAYTGGAGTISISPSIVISGSAQNVSASPANGAAMTFVGTASTATGQSIAYHKNAFAFVTAPLPLPQGLHFASRKMQDGISMRLVRQYDINTDRIPARLDIYYGYAAIRPAMACRLFAN